MGSTGFLKVVVFLLFSLVVLVGCAPATDPSEPGNTGTDLPDTDTPNTGTHAPGIPGGSSPSPTNQKPVAIISPDTEQSVSVGEMLFFNGSSSNDPDGNTPLTYQWSFTGAATSYQPFNPATPGPVTFTEVGTVTVSLVVTDSAGLASDITSVQVNVFGVGINLPPNGSIRHDNGTGTTGSTGNISIATGASVNFVGNATDPENDPVTYRWSIPANVTTTGSTANQSLSASFPIAGTYVVSLSVSDNAGNTDPTPARVTVTVTDPSIPVNLPPNGFISHDNGTGATGSTGNISIATGASVNFVGNATDPENDPVTYRWSIPANVTTTGSTANQSLNASFPVAGTYNIALTVTDNAGNSDPTPAQVIVTVADAPTPVNLPPNGSITHDNGTGATGSSGNVEITVGSSIVFQGLASDPENDPITYTWTFATATASSTTISGPITVRYTTPGTHLVSLSVTDSNGNVDPTPAELTVTVRLPEFKFLPKLSDQDGNLNDNNATYNLTVDSNVNVNVATLDGSWVTPMMRYNSLQLPPVIVARRGTRMTFNVNNNLSQETTIHWHGFKVPASQDGGPDMPIAAGGSRTYNFTLAQPGGPLWFHPHAHGTTATQVYNGLAGAFIVTDNISENLESNNQIPRDEQDIALLLQDRSFGADTGNGRRLLSYSAGGGMMGMAGMLGNRMLVNGVEMPELDVSTRQYRFRLYNGSNARTYDVALSDNANFTVVGTDGGLLDSPVVTDHIMLSAGERAEIVVDFRNYTVGENIRLVSRAFAGGGMMGGGSAVPNGSAFDLMQFYIDRSASDNVSLYSSLPSTAEINDRLTAAQATATRDFVMSVVMQMGVGMQFLINGQTFDINRIDEVVTAGTTEIWNISNTSTMAHPFHAHAIQWQILDRNGVPATGVDLGWKDTVLVQPNETVRFIGRFDPVINIGTYMYHCHILEHEEAGMMGTFLIQ